MPLPLGFELTCCILGNPYMKNSAMPEMSTIAKIMPSAKFAPDPESSPLPGLLITVVIFLSSLDLPDGGSGERLIGYRLSA